MPGKKKAKVEAWLTAADYEQVRENMRSARISSVAAYTRACVLAGAPREALLCDVRLGELALAVNRLSRSVDAGSQDEVAALVLAARKLTRALQSEHAKRHRKQGERW